ncbi:type II secretion system protein [Haloferula sp.]|uniref:type II secretion system protein n=1 Tax=Haloferula sp. TaxID=2497595 RepID=UPI00329EDB6E
MKAFRPTNNQSKGGFTLIEMSLVIVVLIALMTTGIFFSSAIGTWNAGRLASETLRSVYVAQRTYMADHPTSTMSSLTEAKLIHYLPDQASTFPKVEGLDSTLRSININVSPPVVKDSSGSTYDPSGDPNDSLWDVGE